MQLVGRSFSEDSILDAMAVIELSFGLFGVGRLAVNSVRAAWVVQGRRRRSPVSSCMCGISAKPGKLSKT